MMENQSTRVVKLWEIVKCGLCMFVDVAKTVMSPPSATSSSYIKRLITVVWDAEEVSDCPVAVQGQEAIVLIFHPPKAIESVLWRFLSLSYTVCVFLNELDVLYA